MTMNSTKKPTISLAALSIGFCTDIVGEEALRAAGVERVWRRGNGAESLDDAVFEFRGRPGVLAVTDDLRIFGTTQKEIFARCSALLDAEIKVVDIRYPGENIHDLQRRDPRPALFHIHTSTPLLEARSI